MFQSLLVLAVVGMIVGTIGACIGVGVAILLGLSPNVCMVVGVVSAEGAFLGMIILEGRRRR